MLISKLIEKSASINSSVESIIEEHSFADYMDRNDSFYLKNGVVFSSYIFKDEDLYIKLRYFEGVIQVYYGQKVTDKLVVELNKVAQALEAKLLISPNQEYPRHKILGAQKRLAKKSKIPEVEYQKESFGGNNMWLATRALTSEVMDFFGLEGEEKEWKEALEAMYACSHMFLYEFRGWTFLAGQLVDSLFAEEGVTGEEAIERQHVDKLLEWGETFNDIQLYMHYDRSMYFNAFYRVFNSDLVYGEYETESYQKKYGKMPKNVKDLPDNNANTVAIEWSYEPDYLRFQKELDKAKAWAVRLEEKD